MFALRWQVAVLVTLTVTTMAALCNQTPPPPAPTIPIPFDNQLSLIGSIQARVVVPAEANPANLVVKLDGSPVVLAQSASNDHVFEGPVNVAAVGAHQLTASITGGGFSDAARDFETVDLENPAECEVLNNVECLLPYPSDRFLAADATRLPPQNPLRMEIPSAGLPVVNGPPLDPSPYTELDGFSPTSSVLMHFPGGPDLALSNASRLLAPGAPSSPPWTDTRTYDDTSLQATSPTLLIHADTGQKILHYMELDAHATGPERQALVMRPAVALIPGERYIVAIRNTLVDSSGVPLEAEPTFAVLRDTRFTTIAPLNARRPHYENDIFPQLAAAGVNRADLILAFDFTVQSEAGLTSQVISMRDQGFAWLAAQIGETFSVDSVEENNCGDPGVNVWRIVRGTYEVPLFLTQDPELINNVGVLNVDGAGVPVQNGLTEPPFTISIPCTVLDPSPPVAHPIVLGHGLFGTGDGLVSGFAGNLGFDYIMGATNWRGLSNADQVWVATQIIGIGTSELNSFPALPDRLKQGQINTQVLARMMKDGLFNSHACFQTRSPNPADCTTAGPDPLAEGVFPGASEEMFYYGISLGGIMGAYFAALTPDIERFNIDVPAMNFSVLLQRSTQFVAFEGLLASIGISDPMDTILGLSVLHELWVRGEPAGYVHLLAADIASNTKKVLMTMAWLDKQVSNQAQEVLARSLGLPNLVGSVQENLVAIPDVAGPVDSAVVIYDTGSFDIFDPAHEPFIPPLANLIPSGVCDPHSARLTIPASLDQLAAFMQPGGQISNFCTGVCDGTIPYEKPDGAATSCDPLNP